MPTFLPIEEAQQFLPRGLELKQEVLPHDQRTPGAIGQVFRAEDLRLGDSAKATRAVRVVCRDTEDAWWSRFLDRCRVLAEQPADRLVRPLEVGLPRPDVVFLVTDWLPTNLAGQLPAQGLRDLGLIWSVIDQLAEGLAELHAGVSRPAVAHGDVCLENTFLDSAPLDRRSQIRLGDAAVCQIPSWSNGERFVNRMRVAFPPECQQKPKEASLQADLYALGIVALQLLLGTGVVEQALSNESVARVGLWNVVEPSVRRKLGPWSWRHRRWLSQALAVDPDHRFPNGFLARAALPKSIWQSVPTTFAAAIFVFVLCGVVAEHSLTSASHNRELQAVIQRSEESRNDGDKARSELATVFRQKEQLQDRLDIAKKRISELEEPPPPPDPGLQIERLAKESWRELMQRVGMQWENLGKELDTLVAEKLLKPEILDPLKRWAKDVTAERAFWQTWTDRDRAEERLFVKSWTTFVSTPWDASAKEQAAMDREALTIGSEIWERSTSDKGDSWLEFCRKVNSAADGQDNKRVKTVLNAWIKAFDQQTKWTLRIHSAKAPKGYGTERYISTFTADEKRRYSVWEKWPTDEGFDPPDKVLERKRELIWKPGEPFHVWVESEASFSTGFANKDLLVKELRGPVVLWSLRKRQTIEDASYKGQIELEVERCPGPP